MVWRRSALAWVVMAGLWAAPQVASARASLNVEDWLRRPGVKLVVVEFYATWCKPCMAAVPKWKALHDKYEKDGLRLIVVATQDADGACANPGWAPDEVICDDDGFLAERFGATSLPAAYLWGWQGHLLAKKAHVEQVEGQIERWMRRTPRVLVQVKDVAKGAGISRRNLLSTVRAELGRTDKITVVASAAQKKELRAILKASLSANASDKLQCEVGQEVSANSQLTARITGRRKKTLRLELMSAERGCLVASASTRWNPRKPSVSVGEAVAELTGRLRLAKTQYPWAGGAMSVAPSGGQSPAPSGDDYAALLAKAEAAAKAAEEAKAAAEKQRAARMERLERAWKAVSKVAETKALSKRDRLGALNKFLRDFPDDNPHLETAREYARLLKAGKEPRDAPGGMVEVPAGEFFMGCNERVDSECDSDEKPGKRVSVGAFRIDTTEVTVAAYKKCVDAGACSSASFAKKADNKYCNWGHGDRSSHPMNCVNWSGADAFCRWSGKRLPTEKEWEKAARGTDGQKYPWGNAKVSCRYAVLDDGGNGCGRDSTWPVGSKSAGESPYGAKDMVGNVWEWTSDWYSRNETRSIRGGSWGDEPELARASNRYDNVPAFQYNGIGFRCAQSR